MREQLTIAGLVLDVIGALILIIPDVKALYQYTDFGKFRIARQRIEAEGFDEGDPGFDAVTDLVATMTPVEDFHPGREHGQIVHLSLEQFDFPDSVEPDQSALNPGIEYLEAWLNTEPSYADKQYYDANAFQRRIREAIETREQQIRVTGLSLLVVGFFLQLIVLY